MKFPRRTSAYKYTTRGPSLLREDVSLLLRVLFRHLKQKHCFTLTTNIRVYTRKLIERKRRKCKSLTYVYIHESASQLQSFGQNHFFHIRRTGVNIRKRHSLGWAQTTSQTSLARLAAHLQLRHTCRLHSILCAKNTLVRFSSTPEDEPSGSDIPLHP